MALLLIAGALAVLFVAAGWLAYQTLLQNGRILLRIERLEEETRIVRAVLQEAAESARMEAGAAQAPRGPLSGLPPGSAVPDFELPTIDGESLTLWEWRGREVLLIFFDPACGPSQELLSRLGRLRPEPGGPAPLLIGTGDPERNRVFVGAHGLPFPVLVQEEREVARLLRADGTPAAYRIDAEGRTVGERALGVAAVFELLRHAMIGPAEDPSDAPRGVDDLTPLHLPPIPTGTQLRRTGLNPGEPAPPFRLPDLEGRERSLSEFAGQPLLLVFTDPQCRPCRDALPRLERLHRAHAGDLKIVAISRGGREASLAHTREITFPVLLQRSWEVSREYAMFATPIAYLIDEAGTIASRPAIGAKEIVELAQSRTSGATAEAAAT